MLQFSRWSANKPQWKITSCISPRLKRQLQWKLSQLLYDVKSLSRPPTHDWRPGTQVNSSPHQPSDLPVNYMTYNTVLYEL